VRSAQVSSALKVDNSTLHSLFTFHAMELYKCYKKRWNFNFRSSLCTRTKDIQKIHVLWLFSKIDIPLRTTVTNQNLIQEETEDEIEFW
jgi:hypothetical protein